MPQRPPLFVKTRGAILTAELPGYTQGWLLDRQVRQLSDRTIDSRRQLLEKLEWFLNTRQLVACGRNRLRAFLAYVATGHQDSMAITAITTSSSIKVKPERWRRSILPSSGPSTTSRAWWEPRRARR